MPRTIDHDRLAAEIAPYRLLSPTGRRLLTANLTASEYVEILRARGLPADGVRFLAAWLPPREAIWWGCLCLELASDPERQPVEELAALGTLARWVANPEQPGKLPKPESIPAKGASRLARAAQAAREPRSPADALVPAQVSSAILLTAARLPPAQAVQEQRRFLALGMEIARGKYLWNS